MSSILTPEWGRGAPLEAAGGWELRDRGHGQALGVSAPPAWPKGAAKLPWPPPEHEGQQLSHKILEETKSKIFASLR